ncbi:hypothetical protein Tco_0783319 [Tanacetum coccineum]
MLNSYPQFDQSQSHLCSYARTKQILVMIKVRRNEGQKEKGTRENINTTPPPPPDPSISFITEKVHKLNSFLKSPDLVPRASDTKFVCTKDDGAVMFIQIIKKYDDCHEEGLEDEENATIEGLEVEYFDTFLTRSELAYRKYLMSGPIPSWFLRNPIITEGCPSNLKIPCNIRHVHMEKDYIDLKIPFCIRHDRMSIIGSGEENLTPMEDQIRSKQFHGKIRDMHLRYLLELQLFIALYDCCRHTVRHIP